MTMQFPTGKSTTFNHCAVKKCLYHASPGGDFCKAHKGNEPLFTPDGMYVKKSTDD